MNATIEAINEKIEMMDAKVDKQKDDIITSLTDMDMEANKNEIVEIKEQMKNVKEEVRCQLKSD